MNVTFEVLALSAFLRAKLIIFWDEFERSF